MSIVLTSLEPGGSRFGVVREGEVHKEHPVFVHITDNTEGFVQYGN